MLGLRRQLVVLGMLGIGLLLLWRAKALLSLTVGLAIGSALITAHAVLKVGQGRGCGLVCVRGGGGFSRLLPCVLGVAV